MENNGENCRYSYYKETLTGTRPETNSEPQYLQVWAFTGSLRILTKRMMKILSQRNEKLNEILNKIGVDTKINLNHNTSSSLSIHGITEDIDKKNDENLVPTERKVERDTQQNWRWHKNQKVENTWKIDKDGMKSGTVLVTFNTKHA